MKKTRGFKRVMASILAMVTVATLALTGCGSKKEGTKTNSENKTGNNVIITFAGWGSLSEKRIFTKMVDKFEETHPGIKVNYQHYPGDYMLKLTSNLAANRMPDVFYLPVEEYAAWASAGRLLDISDYLDKSEIYEEGLVWEKSITAFYYNQETGEVGKDGSLYALPKDLGPWAMVYNKTLFQEKGIPLPDPEKPYTWDEFIEVAKKLTSGSGAGKTYGTSNYTLESAIWSNDADFLSEDKKTVTVDTPEFAEALQWVADLALVHGVAPTSEDSATMGWFERWCNGKIGMAWMGPWDQGTFWDAVDFEWDIMPTPMNEKTGKNVSYLGTAAFCVSATTKEAQAAYELIEFLCMAEEAQTINYESGQAVPNIVEMKDDYLAMDKMPKNKQVFLDILEDPEKGKFLPTFFTKNKTWYDYFSAELSKVYSGEMKATDFCKKIQPELQSRLDASK